jgi:hypothetical protein
MSEINQKEDQIKKQVELFKTIRSLIDIYNDNQLKINPQQDNQLIMETHSYGCRCTTCWYKFGGDKHEDKNVTSVYTDIFNSNKKFYTD